jgi:hypothetical protein
MFLIYPHPEEANVAYKKVCSISLGLLLLFAFAAPVVLAQDTPALNDIVIQKSLNQMEVRLVISGSVDYESFTLFNPNRLVIDLLQMREFRSPAEINVNDFGVNRIRTAKNRPDVVRVVFDLAETVPSYSIEDQNGTVQIVFRMERPSAKPAAKPVQKPEEKEVRTQPTRKPVTPPRTKPRQTPSAEPRAEGDAPSWGRALSINLGGGLYMPQSSDFQDVYDSTSTLIGGGLTFYLPLSGVERLGLSLEGSYISDTGKTTFTEEEVKLTMIPVMFDVFYQRKFGRFAPFAGLGGSYFSYKEELPPTFAVSEVTGNVMGFNFLVGTHIEIIRQLGVRALLRYHVAKKTEEETEINLSGSELSIGLSYFFNFK